MFNNGKLMKKKKTQLSDKPQWSESDAINFDLEPGSPENNKFLLVLSSFNGSGTTSLSSSSSPESPEIPKTNSRKDRHIAHAVIGAEMWQEMKSNPRKQLSKAMRLV